MCPRVSLDGKADIEAVLKEMLITRTNKTRITAFLVLL